MRVRGFERISHYQDVNLPLPERKTASSAGYDFTAAEAVVAQPGKVTLIPTGIKAYMPADEYLGIHIRSGLAVKHQLSLVNGQGIIDADYYNNPDNEGHIMVAVINHGQEPVLIEQGTRVAQGVFYKYLLADGDDTTGKTREGGFGSTGII